MSLSRVFGSCGRIFYHTLQNHWFAPVSVRYRHCETSSLNLQKRSYSDALPAQCKVAIVTGGAVGIGYHIVEHLICAGAQAVIIGDIREEDCVKVTCELNEKYGDGKALFQICDVACPDQLETLFKCTKEKFGKINIVVNNAGILNDGQWEKMLAININGTVHGTLLGFKYMGANNGGPGGTIINLSSIAGLGPLHYTPVYCGTKHFVLGFTRCMGSKYFCDLTQVKVMAVCPGVTDTALISDASKTALKGFGNIGCQLRESLAALPAQGAHEVGKAVIELLKADDNGTAWVTEGCEIYKAMLPDRATFKPPGGCGKKDPCGKKEDPCKKKDPCKKEDPCKKKDPCAKKEDPCKKKDPCKKC